MIDKQRLRTFLLGGAVGALAGILLAPRSGREVRGRIANRAGEAREKSRERYFETQERLQERLSETLEGAPRPGTRTEPGVTLGTPAQPEVQKTFTGRPRLRDVSEESSTDAKSEDLRRKVQETRERLRSRLESPGRETEDGNQDE